jgi:hypothetical protein
MTDDTRQTPHAIESAWCDYATTHKPRAVREHDLPNADVADPENMIDFNAIRSARQGYRRHSNPASKQLDRVSTPVVEFKDFCHEYPH